MSSSAQTFTETVDCARACIAAGGCLTVQAADLICGTAEALLRSGHRCITVDLRQVVLADQEAPDLLEALVEQLRARSARVVVLREPIGQQP